MIELRPPRDGDAEALFPLVHGTRVVDTLLWDGPSSLEDLRRSLADRAEATARGEQHFFVVDAGDGGPPVGSCDLRPGPDGAARRPLP